MAYDYGFTEALEIQTIEHEIIRIRQKQRDASDELEIFRKKRLADVRCDFDVGFHGKQCRKALNNDISHRTSYIQQLENDLIPLIEKQRFIMSQRKEITIPIVKAVVFNESKIVDEPIITVIPKTVSSIIDDEIPFL